MATNTINGFTYFDAPDTDGCKGCVAENYSPLCAQLQQTGGSYNYCAEHEVIWILPQDKPANTISTPSGMFQQAPVEGREYESLFNIAQALQSAGVPIQECRNMTLLRFIQLCDKHGIILETKSMQN